MESYGSENQQCVSSRANADILKGWELHNKMYKVDEGQKGIKAEQERTYLKNTGNS